MGLRFIHSADWHLDRPFKGLSYLPENIKKRIQESTFKAMDSIVSLAIDEQVDFVIIAGDLFDQNHRSLKAQMRAKTAFERLRAHQIDVYLSHGNHDPLSDPSVQVDFPDNVHVFSSKVTCFEHRTSAGSTVHLYGFSYPKRHVIEDMTPFYEKKEGAELHIGILHGSFKGNTDHDHYAPFNIESLESKRFDYWALGHIHKRSELKQQPFIAYSGNIQGLSSKETGEKGVLLAEWQADQLSVSHKITSDMVWQDAYVDASNVEDLQNLLFTLEQLKNEKRKQNVPILLKIIFTGSGRFSHKLYEPAVLEELLDFLRDGEDEEDTFIWVRSIQSQMTREWNRTELKQQPSFIGEMLRYSDQLNNEKVREGLKGVYGHVRARKFLEDLSDEKTETIRAEAEQLLIQQLYPIQKGGLHADED